jgi:hypothetical protein
VCGEGANYVFHVLAAVYGTQMVEPGCNFPRNFTGTWFTTGEFDTEVIINQTHIYFKTKLDQFTYIERLFTCQQTRDTRYLVTAVTIGRWCVPFSNLCPFISIYVFLFSPQ